MTPFDPAVEFALPPVPRARRDHENPLMPEVLNALDAEAYTSSLRVSNTIKRPMRHVSSTLVAATQSGKAERVKVICSINGNVTYYYRLKGPAS